MYWWAGVCPIELITYNFARRYRDGVRLHGNISCCASCIQQGDILAHEFSLRFVTVTVFSYEIVISHDVLLASGREFFCDLFILRYGNRFLSDVVRGS